MGKRLQINGCPSCGNSDTMFCTYNYIAGTVSGQRIVIDNALCLKCKKEFTIDKFWVDYIPSEKQKPAK